MIEVSMGTVKGAWMTLLPTLQHLPYSYTRDILHRPRGQQGREESHGTSYFAGRNRALHRRKDFLVFHIHYTESSSECSECSEAVPLDSMQGSGLCLMCFRYNAYP